MVIKKSNTSTRNLDFYNTIINCLKTSTNLSKIKKKLNISKQKLNYHLRRLLKNGLIERKGKGWYEVSKSSNTPTQYDSNIKDLTRGHAYIWKIRLSKKPNDWNKRINLLKKHKINYKLVGAMKNIPRIKVYGRKVWLCNDYLRVWEKKGSSFYGDTATQAKTKAFNDMKIVMKAIENKLGINLRPYYIGVIREHYAMIQNDLAIYHNKQGEILKISDKHGEWLLVDDSLGEGGELENVGNKSLPTHTVMKKWWNDHKKNNFEVTPSFILKSIGGLVQTQQMNADNIVKHQRVLDEMSETLKQIRDSLKK